MSNLLRICKIAVLVCLSFTAANSQYRFDLWTTDDGLPQNTTRSVIQTHDGYIWFTTFDGLVRFDGTKFIFFNNSNTEGLLSTRFLGLFEDDEQTLWMTTAKNTLTTYHQGNFKNYSAAENLNLSSSLDFRLNENHEMVFIFNKNEYYFLDEKFIPVNQESTNSYYSKPFLGKSGSVWSSDGQTVFQKKGGQIFKYPLKFKDVVTEYLGHRPAYPLSYEDKQGCLWAYDSEILYKLKDGNITKFPTKSINDTNKIVLPFGEDEDGNILLWNINEIYRFKDGVFTGISKESNYTLPPLANVMQDREGSIWAATEKGLLRIQKQLFKTYSTQNGLISNEVYPILESKNGDIWFGTPLGLSCLRKGKFINYPLPDGMKYAQALLEDDKGRLWLGLPGGLAIFNDGKLQIVANIGWITMIYQDHKGNIWVSNNNKDGLIKINDDKISARYTVENGLPSDEVGVIYESKNGILWLGTSKGLVKFQDDQFTVYPLKQDSMVPNIRTIYEDAEGTLWIGTYEDGLYRFRDEKFVSYKFENGLFNNGVFQIFEDKANNFWIGSNKGIYRVNKNELNDFADGKIVRINSIGYGKEDGMFNSECNGGRFPSGIVSSDGKFWFPTMGGVTVLNPANLKPNPLPPPVVIENVKVERKQVNFSDEIVVQPIQQNLEIDYTALTFIKSEQAKFRFKLEGQDENWVEADTRRSAFYSYLPPGNYTFRVVAANADGIWNNEGATIKIKILAPFYRTWWFASLVLLVIAGSIFWYFRQRFIQLERRNAMQNAFSQQLIESQEAERKRIAAELHDGLGQTLLLIKNRAFLGVKANNLDSANEQLKEISKTSGEAINQAREIAYFLRPSQLERLGLTSAIKEILRQISESTEINFEFEIDSIDGIFLPENEINFYRVVQESINNILKHSKATRANISVEQMIDKIVVKIEDNGKGFDIENIKKDGKSGFGLLGVEERVRILGGRFAIKSEIGKGTKIHIEIDKNQNEQ